MSTAAVATCQTIVGVSDNGVSEGRCLIFQLSGLMLNWRKCDLTLCSRVRDSESVWA